MKRKLLLALLLFSVTTALCACNGGSYKNNVDVDKLASKALACIPLATGYLDWDDDSIEYYFGEAEELADCEVYESKDGNDHNLFAIFKAKKSGDVNKIKSACESFIKKYSSDISGSVQNYAPGEAEKYENAKVTVYGDYVIVTGLWGNDASAVLGAIETELKN